MEKYQTAARRFVAGFIDGVVFIPLTWVDAWISGSTQSAAVLIGWLLIIYPIYWLYSVLMHGFYGQTLGKMALEIKVVDVSAEAPISVKQAFWRDSIYVAINTVALALSIYYVLNRGSINVDLNSISPAEWILGIATWVWFLGEILTCLTNKKRRALHDFIAGTVVVKTDYVPVVAAENSTNSVKATAQ